MLIKKACLREREREKKRERDRQLKNKSFRSNKVSSKSKKGQNLLVCVKEPSEVSVCVCLREARQARLDLLLLVYNVYSQ